jgi:hypothetical protein
MEGGALSGSAKVFLAGAQPPEAARAANSRRSRGRSLLFEAHQNKRREEDAGGFEADRDLAERHREKGGEKGGGSGQEWHGRIPAVDILAKTSV